ncbi:MAG: branched-chain amino acid ABC transporter permease [Acidimicrobiales bacterium]
MRASLRNGVIGIVIIDLVYVLANHVGADYKRLLTLSAVDGLLVLSLVVLTGLAGQISFVQFEFAGFGALTTGALVAHSHWSYWAALPVAVLAAAGVGVVVGIPALRLRGLILGVVTLALALSFDDYVFTLGPFAKGTVVGRPSLLGWKLHNDLAAFAFCMLVLVACCVLVTNLQRSKTGRIFAAIRDSEVAARTAGIDVVRYKLQAFAISAGLAGLAGALLAMTVGNVDRNSFTLLQSINIAAVVILMGPNLVASAVAGGVFLAWGGEVLRHVGVSINYFNVILGGALVLQLIAAPDGAVAQATKVLMAPSQGTP